MRSESPPRKSSLFRRFAQRTFRPSSGSGTSDSATSTTGVGLSMATVDRPADGWAEAIDAAKITASLLGATIVRRSLATPVAAMAPSVATRYERFQQRWLAKPIFLRRTDA